MALFTGLQNHKVEGALLSLCINAIKGQECDIYFNYICPCEDIEVHKNICSQAKTLFDGKKSSTFINGIIRLLIKNDYHLTTSGIAMETVDDKLRIIEKIYFRCEPASVE